MNRILVGLLCWTCAFILGQEANTVIQKNQAVDDGQQSQPQVLDEKRLASPFSWNIKLIHDIFTHSGEINDWHLLHFANPSFTWNLSALPGFDNTLINMQFLSIYDFNKPLHYEPVQGISNIAADNVVKLYQWSIQKELPEKGLSLYLGLFDFNSEFDCRQSSALFLNPSHGIGVDISQTGYAGPSIFPNLSFAFRLGWDITDYLRLNSAVIDAVPGSPANPASSAIIFDNKDGFLIANELQLTGAEKEPVAGYHKTALGAWFYTAQEENLSATGDDHNYGLYASTEKYFGDFAAGFNGAAIFLRGGFANNNLNSIEGYAGAGLLLFPSVTAGIVKTVGVSFAYGSVCNAYREINPGLSGFELIGELTILFQPYEALSLQPDLQYVKNPLGLGKDVIFAGLRVQMEY